VKRISVPCSQLLLKLVFQLPEDCEVTGAQWDFEHRILKLYVEGDSLPYDQYDGCQVMAVTPTATSTAQKVTVIDWGLIHGKNS